MSERNQGNLSLYKSIGLLVLGTAILAFGTAVFLLPFRLISGGISSLAILAEFLFQKIHAESWITLFTCGFFLLGFVVLGRSFAMKTLLSTVLYPSFVSLFTFVAESKMVGHLFSFLIEKSEVPSLLLISVLSGLFVGTGCAIAYRQGGSTGGVDILSLVLCKAFPKLRHSVLVFTIDATVISLGIFITRNIKMSLFGILSALVASVIVDRFSCKRANKGK